MLNAPKARVRHLRLALAAVLLATLAGCGQKGPLFLPTNPAAANRATLPQTLSPASPTTPTTPASPAAVPAAPAASDATGTASPIRIP